MIERGEHLRLTPETREALRIGSKCVGKKLDGHAAFQLQVDGLIDIPKPSGTQVGCDLVVCEPGSNHVVENIRERILPKDERRQCTIAPFTPQA